ncbi:MAG: hypothetical protein HYU99_00810 [Deltaproteobacteria bacterium]|nr:hypothetical protein [Deltaproteobacteria bacterium]
MADPIDPNKGALSPPPDLVEEPPISEEGATASPPLTNLSAGSVAEGGEGGFVGGDKFVSTSPPAAPWCGPLTTPSVNLSLLPAALSAAATVFSPVAAPAFTTPSFVPVP